MSAVLQALVILGLVLVNAFFVAAEYSLLSVRRTRIEQLAREGDARARLVQKLLAEVGVLFSGTQLGVSIASLLMGWLGERALAAAIEPLLDEGLFREYTHAAGHAIALALAFALITAFLMVLGELAPKALAYERAERVSLLVARPMHAFLRVARAPVRALNGLAKMALGAFGAELEGGTGALHTADEAKLIVSAIRKRGLLREEQEEMIRGVFDLHRVLVREIMVPWPRITSLALESDLDRLLDQVVKDQHSRIPIYEATPDHVVGILYTKDLLGVVLDRRRQGVSLASPFDLRSLLHPPMIVPETMPLNQMLDEARRKHSQMALVVDEFGTYTGLVTIEDVLEEIVGEIQDEYDREEKAIQKVSENVLLVDAALGLRELAEDYGIRLPRGAGYETLAGFLLARLGLIPRGGETLVFEGRRYTVAEMDGRRISKVRVERLPAAVAASQG
ncbi:MAG TPA: hemolysin family protein [Terriglobia bacterium]|nr:hemolysin family protein [Terriglobia bacterium]